MATQVDVRHSSVDPFVPTFMHPWVRIPNTTLTLFQFIFDLRFEKTKVSIKRQRFKKEAINLGGSHGLKVIGEDSRLEGYELKSQSWDLNSPS